MHVILMLVGYMMDNLILETLSTSVEFDSNMGMPEVAITEAAMYDCSQNYTTGAFYSFYIHSYLLVYL